MKTVYELALAGLSHVISAKDRSAAHLVEQEAQGGPAEEQEPEGGGGHGSGSVKAQRYLRESTGKHDHENGATYPLLDAGEERQANGTEGEPRGEVVHGLCLQLLLGNLRQRRIAVHMVKRDGQTVFLGELDQQARTVWRKLLSALVVADISLRAIDPIGKGLLGHAEAFTDGFEVVHGPYSSITTMRRQ